MCRPLTPYHSPPFFSLSKQILFENGHQVALEVDVDGVRHRLSPAPLLLAPACHLPLLIEGVLCGRGGCGWGLWLCGRSLWGVSGRGRSWRRWSKHRLLLLATAGVFCHSTSLFHYVLIVPAKFFLLSLGLFSLCFQLSLSLLFLSRSPSELFKAVAGRAHGRGRRGLGPLSQTGPGTHIL